MSLRSTRPRHGVAAAPGPIRVKELAARAVDALVGVGAEIVVLDFKEVVQVVASRLSIRREDAKILQRRLESGFEVAEGCRSSQLGDRLTLGDGGQQRARSAPRVVADPAQGGTET